MQEYTSKEALAEAIKKTATPFIKEFDDVAEHDSDLRLEGVDRRHSGAKFASGKSYAQNFDMTIFLDKGEHHPQEKNRPVPVILWQKL